MPLEAGDIASIAQALKDLGPPGIQAASLKLPDFWTDKPDVWFACFESQFGTKQITGDQTKFDYVVSSLDNSTAGEVEAILTNPPQANKYNALKTALLAAFGKTQTQKDSELLSITGLGDMKPTALLRRLQSLNSDPTTLFRAHFLALLPSEVRSVLAAHSGCGWQQKQKHLSSMGLPHWQILFSGYRSRHLSLSCLLPRPQVSSQL